MCHVKARKADEEGQINQNKLTQHTSKNRVLSEPDKQKPT